MMLLGFCKRGKISPLRCMGLQAVSRLLTFGRCVYFLVRVSAYDVVIEEIERTVEAIRKYLPR